MTGQELNKPKAEVGLIAKVAGRYSLDPGFFAHTVKATAFKVKDREATNEELAMLLAVADHYGLDVWTKQIHAFVSQSGGVVPIVGIDGWNHLEQSHPQFDGEEIEEPPRDEWVTMDGGAKICPPWLRVTIHRKDHSHPTVHVEYLDECYRPPMKGYGGPWQSHTKRMLLHKARIQAIRECFGYGGIYDEDEGQRVLEGEVFAESGEVTFNPEVKPQPKVTKAQLTKLPAEMARTGVPWDSVQEWLSRHKRAVPVTPEGMTKPDAADVLQALATMPEASKIDDSGADEPFIDEDTGEVIDPQPGDRIAYIESVVQAMKDSPVANAAIAAHIKTTHGKARLGACSDEQVAETVAWHDRIMGEIREEGA